jgi:rhamnogalacturonyl hydrolase YesR
MAMMLKVLPKENEHYGTIEKSYLKMMSALLEYQRKDVLWGQLVDDKDSWKTSFAPPSRSPDARCRFSAGRNNQQGITT